MQIKKYEKQKTQLSSYLTKNHLDEIITNDVIDAEILSKFPVRIYKERNIERNLWLFLKRNQKILISGWAGSGKTSLLLYTLQKFECLNEKAYYVHFEKYKIDIKNQDNASNLIDGACSFLRSNYVNSSKLQEDFYLYSSMLLRVPYHLEDLDLFNYQINNPSNESYHEANTKLEKLRLELNDTKIKSIKQDINSILNNNNKIRFHALVSYITYYLKKSIYFIYDNIDTESLQIQKDFLEAINTTIFPEANNNFKIVVLIRSTNLYDSIARNADSDQDIARFPISIAKGGDCRDIFQKEKSLIFDVYLTRLDNFFDKKQTSLRKRLFDIITNFKTKEVELGILHSNIFDLANHSIRFALKLINDFSFWIIHNDLDAQLNAMPVTYIHSIFFAWLSIDKYDLSVRGLDPLEIIKQVESDYHSFGCDLEYLVLTFMSNKKEIQFQDLFKAFRRTGNISQETLKDTVFSLYKNKDSFSSLLGKFGHIVFLHNRGEHTIIDKYTQISNSTRISIMPRAKAILEVSFKFTFSNYLYFHRYIDISATEYFNKYLEELPKYFDYQYEMLLRLYTVHLVELKRISERYQNAESWVNNYKNDFSYNGKLQLENIILHNNHFITQLIKSLTGYSDIQDVLKDFKEKYNKLYEEYNRAYLDFGDTNSIKNLFIEYIKEKFFECSNTCDYDKYYNHFNKTLELKHYFRNSNNLKDFSYHIKVLANKKFEGNIHRGSRGKVFTYFDNNKNLKF